MNGYGIGDTIKNAVSYVYTKLFWKKARLVRLPIVARNRKNIRISSGFTCGSNCRLNPGENGIIAIGERFVMGDLCQIEAMRNVTIGDDVLLASKVYIGDSSHGSYSNEAQTEPSVPPNDRPVFSKEIHIADRVWIGNGVSILPGVHIGEGCVIGAGSVVTHDIPSNTIAVGNPARVIKYWDGSEWKRMI